MLDTSKLTPTETETWKRNIKLINLVLKIRNKTERNSKYKN